MEADQRGTSLKKKNKKRERAERRGGSDAPHAHVNALTFFEETHTAGLQRFWTSLGVYTSGLTTKFIRNISMQSSNDGHMEAKGRTILMFIITVLVGILVSLLLFLLFGRLCMRQSRFNTVGQAIAVTKGNNLLGVTHRPRQLELFRSVLQKKIDRKE